MVQDLKYNRNRKQTHKTEKIEYIKKLSNEDVHYLTGTEGIQKWKQNIQEQKYTTDT